MKEKYIYWKHPVELRIATKERYTMYVFNEGKVADTFTVNETGAYIVSLINGKHTLPEIVKLCAEKYNVQEAEAKKNCNLLLDMMQNQFNLELGESLEVSDTSVSIKTEYFPEVATIELTENCNIRCIHCYGDYGSETKRNQITLNECRKILKDLSENGIHTLELTGGEITTHPQFREILEYALECGIENIALLTNGIVLKNDIKKLIIKYANRIRMQIDLHSLREDYLEWFTKTKNILPIIKENIRFCVKNNIRIRVAIMMTPENLCELEEIVDWAYAEGAHGVGLGMVYDMGRACADPKLRLTQENDLKLLGEIIERLVVKYPHYITEIDKHRQEDRNCGSISTHFVISSTGETKLCSLDAMGYCNTSLGNMKEQNIKEIYESNKAFVKAYAETYAPNSRFEECKICEHANYCQTCILRGIIKAKELEGKCGWYNHIVPMVVKEHFQLEGYEVKK